ncbi:MAG: PAS domain-containing protein [Burkholderiales bacterium]|nr:PAS domain-containing protein [Burkholderiales bacterium]
MKNFKPLKLGKLVNVPHQGINTPKLNLENHFEIMEELFNVMPFVFWKDLQGKYLGCNLNQARAFNFKSISEFIGRTIFEILDDPEAAKLVDKTDNEIMSSGKSLIIEETIPTPYGIKTYLSQKQPVYSEGKVVGLLGFAMDITEMKAQQRFTQEQNEKLVHEKHELEIKNYKIIVEQQEKFKKIVGQMVHDIQSPITTLNTLVQTLSTVEEQKRITLRRAIMNISDITNHMLNRYKPREDNGELSENNHKQSVLVSSVLYDILSEKRYEYKDKSLKFISECEDDSLFAFIKVEPSSFRRAISNLVNNAVQALPKKNGIVKLRLRANDEWVFLRVEDNGCGIPKDILKKIEEKESVTANKDDGHGIGLSQVHSMLDNNHGDFEIYSRTGANKGTKVILKFPRGLTPDWIAQEIVLTPANIIVIVDDDESIHGAWDARLEFILQKMDKIIVKHFIVGNEALAFMGGLSTEDLQRVLLLSDYELIEQNLTGLEMIAQSKIKNAILVTSHYNNAEVRQMAAKQVVKILPKDLSSKVPIRVDLSSVRSNKNELLNVHMVFVDDQPEVTHSIVSAYYKHLVIDSYINPYEFLANVEKYPKDTKIFLDNLYYMEHRAYDIDGVQIAQKLHDMGYTRLFLLSGDYCWTPDYLTLILKDDKEKLTMLDKL